MNECKYNFKIHDIASIEIIVPGLEDKRNYYYRPSGKLHKFDVATVLLKMNNTEIILCIDVISEILMTFRGSLERGLEGLSVLPDTVGIGKLGFFFNINVYQGHFDAIPFSQFWLWSSETIQSWLYSSGNTLYLEIAPSYRWLYVKPIQKEKSEQYITFEHFMRTYVPLLVIKIDRPLAIRWLACCKCISDDIIKSSDQKN